MAMINFANAAITFPAEKREGKYSLKAKDTLLVSGNIYFGIEASDPADVNNIRSGISSVELYIDTAKYFSQTYTRFAFPETRYVNTVVDYPMLKEFDREIRRSYISTNNKLDNYNTVKNHGIVSFSASSIHRIRYVVKDAFGNAAVLTFYVKSHPPAPGRRPQGRVITGTFFPCGEENKLKADGCDLTLPLDALYDDLDFTWSKSDTQSKGYYSKIYRLHNDLTPLQKACTLTIRTENLPARLQTKAVIVRINGNRQPSSIGGDWKDGWITASIREFGNYSVMADTVPPAIRPLNIYAGKNISKQSTIRVKISDNLSGIKYYRGTLDGKWILMDFDAKTGILEYQFDDRRHTGKNDFRLVVKDGSGNQSEYRATITR